MTETERNTLTKHEDLIGTHHDVSPGELVFITEGYDKGLYRRIDARGGDYWEKLTDPLELKHAGILSKEEAYKRARARNHGEDLAEQYPEHRPKKW